MSQQPSRGQDRPLILSDKQGFDRRWFADKLEAVYVPKRIEEVADQVTVAILAYGNAVKISSGRHCYENFVYNSGTGANKNQGKCSGKLCRIFFHTLMPVCYFNNLSYTNQSA